MLTMQAIKCSPQKCPVEYTLNVIGGKWKTIIIWSLATNGVQRYGELRRNLPKISHKMLSQQLKELEADGIINRKEYQQIPPKVEYSITERGKSLIPILDQMVNWALKDMRLEEAVD